MKVKRNVIEPRVTVANEVRRAEHAERAVRAKQAERNDLLAIAQCFIAKDEKQDPAKVLVFAEELLAWMNESANDLDRSARRDALRKVEAASWNAGLRGISTSELIEQASVYYRFIAA